MTTWVMLAGLPATGKSTLARALASRLNSVTLDKDRIRNAIFGQAFTDYTREQDDLVMQAMIEAARYLTRRERVEFVLFDGRTFSRKVQIDELIRSAESSGAGWRILHLSCAAAVAKKRLEGGHSKHPARNRDLALLQQIEQSFEAIAYPKLDIDTASGCETQLEAICSYLHSGGASPSSAIAGQEQNKLRSP